MRSAFALMIILSLAAADDARAAGPTRPFRLCVYDEALILQQSKLAANMAARFQQVRREAQTKFEEDSRNLDADERALASLRSSLPPAVAKEKGEEIVRRRAALKAEGEQVNRNLAALDGELTANVGKLAEPSLRYVEAVRGCSVVAAKSLFLRVSDPSLDITAAVLERMNAAPSPTEPRSR